MNPKPAGSKDPLKSASAAGSALSQDFSSRGGLFRPASSEEKEGGARAPWLGGEAGAVLERQLLLANAEAEEFPPRSRRWLWSSLLAAAALIALVAGGFFGFRRIEEGWKQTIATLEGRIASLEKQISEQRAAMAVAREETAAKLAEERKKGQSLEALVEKTRSQLETTVGEVRRLREENEKLELEKRQLKVESEFKVEEFLSQFCPGWLLGLTEGKKN
jgi:hypothetical protein